MKIITLVILFLIFICIICLLNEVNSNKFKGGDAIGYSGLHGVGDAIQMFKLADTRDVLTGTQEDLDDTARGIAGMDGYEDPKDFDDFSYDDYDGVGTNWDESVH